MCVDQNVAIVITIHGVPGEMQLLNRFGRNRADELTRVEAVIHRIHEDIIDVEQQRATGLARERRQKLLLAEMRAREAQIARHVLDEHLPTQDVLHIFDSADHVPEHLVCVR